MIVKLSSNLFDVYRVPRIVNPSPYMYLMQFDDLQLAGASPETLVKVKEGIVTTMPIAGIRPRGKTEEEDKKLNKDCALFKELPGQIIVGRYHSLIVDKKSLTNKLEVMAEDNDGEIMALKYKDTATFGLQFQ